MLMKKFTILCFALLGGFTSNAQLFTDNFESYAAGYLGPQSASWTTWSGAEGGAEDVQISTAQAQSGTNSIYLSSTAASGGPQDVILLFGQQYTSGIFTFETSIYQNSGKNAYFNFQANPTIGQLWAFNFSSTNGSFTVDDGITPDLATGSNPLNEWYKVTIVANLTTHIWKIFIDDVEMGSWINGVNAVTSADIFPTNGSQYYIDDIMFDHQAYSLPVQNGAAAEIDMAGNIAGQTINPIGKLINAGSTPITSFSATLNYNGQNYIENISSVNISSLAQYNVNFPSIQLASGSNIATFSISNVNGSFDDDADDDTTTVTTNPVIPAVGKVVVGEEGTGTWCGWCPRGTVFMDLYEQEFGEFWAGIAVHNNDPMEVAVYDAGVGTLIAGYPSALVDRGPEVDPSAMSNDFYTRLQTDPTAFISLNQSYEIGSTVVSIEVSADFQSAANNNYKLACVLTEDGVTGTISGYAQTNYYAGGGNGVMGGFETLPSPVPAAQMVYDHVARAIAPDFNGDETSFPATVNPGEVHSKTFTFDIPSTWDTENMHVIGLLIAPNGTIDNAFKADLEVPVNLNIESIQESKSTFSIFPNPATLNATIGLDLKTNSSVEIELVDLSGKTISMNAYSINQGFFTVDVNTSKLNAGIYFVNVTINGKSETKRLVIQ